MMDIRFRLGEKGLYRMVNAVLLTGIGLFGAGSYLGIAAPGVLHMFVALVSIFMLTCFNYLSARGRILCMLSVAGCLGATGVVAGLENSIRFFVSYIRWLLNRPLWQEEWVKGYEVIQVLLLVLFCYLLQMVIERDFRIKAAGAFVLLAVLVYSLLEQKEQTHTAVAFLICYLVTAAVEGTQRHWNKVKSRSIQAYMLWMMPFLIVYFLLFLWMPVPQKPYDWQVFKDVYHQLKESFLTISQNMASSGREDYDLGLSGFSESGSIGGGFLESDKEVMMLKGSRGLVTNVYLIGKVYDSFDGKQWQQSGQTENAPGERYLDTIETLYAAQRYDSEYLQDYLSRVNLQVSYRYFHSGFLFAPLKTRSIKKKEANGADLYFEDRDGSLNFGQKQGYGTEYEVTFYQMNIDQEAFYEFLETKTEPDWQLWKHVGENVTAEAMQKHRQMIYDHYLEDFSLSKEAEAYLEQIVGDADTNVEKLRAIEEELSSFTYSRTPGELPDTVMDGSSFLDYFLLESREGYCSHFATAFVLLARAEGIPARYVQGYCVPIKAEEEVMVTSNMAHAWPEVYLEDIGWIPFEPTPGYGVLRYTPWKTKKGEQKSYTAETGRTGLAENGAGEAVKEEVEAEEEAGTMRQNMTDSFVRLLWIAGVTGASVIAVGLLVLLAERLVGRWRYGRMSDRQKYIVEIGRIFKILSKMGIDRGEDETLAELGMRISEHLSMEEKLHFVEDYEEFLYGNRCADPQMIQLAKEEQDKLLQMIKQKKKWKYIYYCIFIKYS